MPKGKAETLESTTDWRQAAITLDDSARRALLVEAMKKIGIDVAAESFTIHDPNTADVKLGDDLFHLTHQRVQTIFGLTYNHSWLVQLTRDCATCKLLCVVR
jgi:hypothetical protein